MHTTTRTTTRMALAVSLTLGVSAPGAFALGRMTRGSGDHQPPLQDDCRLAIVDIHSLLQTSPNAVRRQQDLDTLYAEKSQELKDTEKFYDMLVEEHRRIRLSNRPQDTESLGATEQQLHDLQLEYDEQLRRADDEMFQLRDASVQRTLDEITAATLSLEGIDSYDAVFSLKGRNPVVLYAGPSVADLTDKVQQILESKSETDRQGGAQHKTP